ncbi:MAG: DapH/DapD/GlmU-related protein [Rickettsiales bacterium]
MVTTSPMILPYKGEYAPDGEFPSVYDEAFIAAGAAVIGDVEIGTDSSIWFGCVVRGDVNYISIGSRTNIQDGTVIHVTRKTNPTIIGDNVTVGHGALLHGCTLEDGCFIGMRATLMDGVVVESGAQVAAGALVTPNKRIPKGQLWAGSPAKYFRDLTEEEQQFINESADNYVKLTREYLAMS